MSTDRRTRLDTPRDTRRQIVRRPSVDADAFGVFAESFARYMGTAKFLLWIGIVMVMSAGGDVMIVLEILKNKSRAEDVLYMDHPTQAGGVLFER